MRGFPIPALPAGLFGNHFDWCILMLQPAWSRKITSMRGQVLVVDSEGADSRDPGASSAGMKSHLSPLRLLAISAASAFGVEFILMLVIPGDQLHDRRLYALLDAAALTLILFPVLYYSLVRPLGRHISQRNLSEQELRRMVETVSRAQREWVETFDGITDLIFITDEEGRILRVNRAVEQFTGISPNLVAGRKCHEVFSGSPWPSGICEQCKDSPRRRAESVDVYPMGDNRHVEVRMIPRIEDGGTKAGCIYVIRDVSAEKRLEVQLRHAQKMEAVGQLAGGIAHDFNNILTAIISCGNLLEIKMGPESPLRTYVTAILEASRRGSGMVRGLLAFSRKELMFPTPVDLNAIVREIDPFLRRTVPEDISLVFSLCDGELPVMADRLQMEQVLINLVSNARDATPAGGTITVATERVVLVQDMIVELGTVQRGVYCRVRVSDSGEGMDEHTRRRMFEPFFTTKEMGRGTGLGLSVVYGIVEQHNGRVDVRSTPGAGTAVDIYLPLAGSPLTDTEPEALPLPGGRGEVVLLAEDEASVRNTLADLLREFGYEVIEATDGADAIAKFQEHRDRIQLVVLDVVMPQMNGQEAWESIRRLGGGKVIFMSGYSPDIMRDRFTVADGVLLQKPIAPVEFLTCVRRLLDVRGEGAASGG